MTGRRFVSPTVALADGRWICAACGHDLGLEAARWKDAAVRREMPLAAAGAAWDTGDAGGSGAALAAGVVLRHHHCPGCARLLDTETAMAGDPPLVDRLA